MNAAPVSRDRALTREQGNTPGEGDFHDGECGGVFVPLRARARHCGVCGIAEPQLQVRVRNAYATGWMDRDAFIRGRRAS